VEVLVEELRMLAGQPLQVVLADAGPQVQHDRDDVPRARLRAGTRDGAQALL
jgi:hypothetical protein